MKKLPKDSRMGSSSGRKGHGLSVHFNIFTTCILSSLYLCVCGNMCDACPSGHLCVLACGSSQTDNHRGGRAESKRDECSVYWNERKDRLQCQTGRACVCVCVRMCYVVPCARWPASLSHWHENIHREHEMFVYLLFKLSHLQEIIHIYHYWIELSLNVT